MLENEFVAAAHLRNALSRIDRAASLLALEMAYWGDPGAAYFGVYDYDNDGYDEDCKGNAGLSMGLTGMAKQMAADEGIDQRILMCQALARAERVRIVFNADPVFFKKARYYETEYKQLADHLEIENPDMYGKIPSSRPYAPDCKP